MPQDAKRRFPLPAFGMSSGVETRWFMGTCKDFSELQLGGGNSHILLFSPRMFGKDEPILASIFFKWVGETTN